LFGGHPHRFPEDDVILRPNREPENIGLGVRLDLDVPLELKSLAFHENLGIPGMELPIHLNLSVLTEDVAHWNRVCEGDAFIFVGLIWPVVRDRSLNAPAIGLISGVRIEHMSGQLSLKLHHRLIGR